MDQDWEVRVIGQRARQARATKKDADVNAARRTGTVVAVEKKIVAGSNKGHTGTDPQKIAKLDRENDVIAPPKVSASVGKAIQTARLELKLSQKDVAAKINEKVSVLQDYESSKAIPNPQILGKLERCLGVKLRGADIGKKLEPPTKKA